MNAVLIGERKRKVIKPVEISLNNTKEDPFYSRSNLEYLKKVTSEIDAGVAKLEEHELIEV